MANKDDIKPDEPKNLEDKLEKDFEAAADEVFGGDPDKASADKGTPVAEDKGAGDKDADDKGADDKDADDRDADDRDAGADDKGTDDRDADDRDADDRDAGADDKGADDKEEDLYQVPDYMKGRTRERYEKLTGTLKQVTEESQKKDSIIQGFKQVIDQTGLSPEEVEHTLSLGAKMKKDPRAALETLNELAADLAERLGVVAPGRDPLTGFDDLKQRVEDREITQEDAETLAKARLRDKAEDRRLKEESRQREQQEESSRTVAEQEAAVTEARTSVAAFLKSAEKDPDFDKIAPKLIAAAKFASEKLAPEDWAGYIQGEYDSIKDVTKNFTPRNRGATPIDEGGAPPGGGKEPKDLDDLANLML